MKSKMKKPLVAMFALLAFPFCMASTNASGSIYHNGKANAQVSISSSLSYEEFKAKANNKISDWNVVSGYKNAVTINFIKQKEDGFDLNMSFRRLDKVKMQGSFLFGEFSSFSIEGSENKKIVENASKGNIETTCGAFYDGGYATISTSRDDRVKIEGKDKENQNVTFEQLMEVSSNSKKNEMMLFYRVFDTGSIDKVTINVPGTISYIGGTGINRINESQVELTPINIPIKITKTITYIDEDGVEKTKTEVTSKRDAKGFAGYFVYAKSLSPVSIGFIITGSIVVVGLIAALLIYFIRLGKKELKKGEIHG